MILPEFLPQDEEFVEAIYAVARSASKSSRENPTSVATYTEEGQEPRNFEIQWPSYENTRKALAPNAAKDTLNVKVPADDLVKWFMSHSTGPFSHNELLARIREDIVNGYALPRASLGKTVQAKINNVIRSLAIRWIAMNDAQVYMDIASVFLETFEVNFMMIKEDLEREEKFVSDPVIEAAYLASQGQFLFPETGKKVLDLVMLVTDDSTRQYQISEFKDLLSQAFRDEKIMRYY